METIIEKVIGYLLGAIDRYRKQHEKAKDELLGRIQIMFMLSADGMAVVIWYCVSYKPTLQSTIKEAMNKKLDLLGMAGATEAFIGNALMTLSQKESIPIEDTRVIAVPNKDEGIDLHLYNKGQAVRQLNIEEIFDPKLLKPQ